MKPSHVVAVLVGIVLVASWTTRPNRTLSEGMNTTTLSKPKGGKRQKRSFRRLKLDLNKPIQGQGVGTATTADDYDPSVPAFAADEWKTE